MKLLKYIRDVLRGGVRLPWPDNDNDNDDNDNDDNDNDGNDDDGNDDNDDNDNDKDKLSEYQEVISCLIEEIDNNNKKNTNYDNVALSSVFINNLNNEISNVKSDGEHYARLIAYQNATIEKLKKELTDRKN